MASARAHNIPPCSVIARRAGGTGPLTRSFLRIDRVGGDVVLSAVKEAENGSSTIVRLFNPQDEDANIVITTDAPLTDAFRLNLAEERQQALPLDAGRVRVALSPRQILTLELRSQ